MSSQIIQFAYLVAAVLLILGLRQLSSPKTAPRGNAMAAVGMLIAIVAALLDQGVVDFAVIVAGIVVGSGIAIVGALLAAGHEERTLSTLLGFIAIVVATINVVGGFVVTNRMLAMFKRKQDHS